MMSRGNSWCAHVVLFLSYCRCFARSAFTGFATKKAMQPGRIEIGRSISMVLVQDIGNTIGSRHR